MARGKPAMTPYAIAWGTMTADAVRPAIASYRSWLRYDAIAGLTASAVIVPQAMAYGVIAGLPLAIGLYTALMPLVVYAAMGTSRALSVTTTSTIAILTANAL